MPETCPETIWRSVYEPDILSPEATLFAPFVVSFLLALKRAHVSEWASERWSERAIERASDRWSERTTERATERASDMRGTNDNHCWDARRTSVDLDSFWTYQCRTWLILGSPVSNLTHFGLTSVLLYSFWTYRCRTWLVLDLPVSNLTHFGITSGELDSFWIHQCRT